MDDPFKDISTTRVSDTSASRIIASIDAPTMDPSTTDTTTLMLDSLTQSMPTRPRPSSIYPLNPATRSTTNSSIPTATKPSTWECTLDPTSNLDPITRLTAIRTKVHKPTVSGSTFYIKAGVFAEMTLKSYAVALKISRIYTVGSGSYIQRWQCYTGKG
ncbi:hypothetical protein D6C99_05360 [Aureobasidium pullulans]|nr:hypothetical protein D6C99_05360 [Aureobasidium pullulans]